MVCQNARLFRLFLNGSVHGFQHFCFSKSTSLQHCADSHQNITHLPTFNSNSRAKNHTTTSDITLPPFEVFPPSHPRRHSCTIKRHIRLSLYRTRAERFLISQQYCYKIIISLQNPSTSSLQTHYSPTHFSLQNHSRR